MLSVMMAANDVQPPPVLSPISLSTRDDRNLLNEDPPPKHRKIEKVDKPLTSTSSPPPCTPSTSPITSITPTKPITPLPSIPSLLASSPTPSSTSATTSPSTHSSPQQRIPLSLPQFPIVPQQFQEQISQQFPHPSHTTQRLAPQHPQPLVSPSSPLPSNPASPIATPSTLLPFTAQLPPVNANPNVLPPLTPTLLTPSFAPSNSSTTPVPMKLRTEVRRRSEQESLEGLVGLADLADERRSWDGYVPARSTENNTRDRQAEIERAGAAAKTELEQIVHKVFEQAQFSHQNTNATLVGYLQMHANANVEHKLANPQVRGALDKANGRIEEALDRSKKTDMSLRELFPQATLSAYPRRIRS